MREKLFLLLPKSLRDFLLRNVKEGQVVPHLNTVFIAFFIMIIGILSFLYLTKEMSGNTTIQFDDEVSNFLISFRNPTLTHIMILFTKIGDFLGYIFLFFSLSVFFIFKKNWKTIFQISLVMVFASGLNFILKNIISRPRPTTDRLVYANFYSFPSGHAMSAIVFYGFLSYISILLIKKKPIRYLFVSACVFMVLLIGASRIYLGVHYPSDILAGYLAGISWLMFSILIVNLITFKKNNGIES